MLINAPANQSAGKQKGAQLESNQHINHLAWICLTIRLWTLLDCIFLLLAYQYMSVLSRSNLSTIRHTRDIWLEIHFTLNSLSIIIFQTIHVWCYNPKFTSVHKKLKTQFKRTYKYWRYNRIWINFSTIQDIINQLWIGVIKQ